MHSSAALCLITTKYSVLYNYVITKHKFSMKHTLLTLIGLLCLCSNKTNAQDRVRPFTKADLIGQERSAVGIAVTGGVSPEKLIKDVFIGGNCFEVKNIKYTGDSTCIGRFSGGKKGINIENGVVMTTGNIKTAEPPNNKSDYSFANLDVPEDIDLNQLISNAQELHDQAVLEFDFTPTANTIQFKFVFASEEYCEYVNSAYNDVFGFFISGPGISGPFKNNAANIALVPGTSSYVSINNVNHQSYSNYFVNNIHQFSFATACAGINSLGKYLKETGYDGFTKVMTATAMVQPCQTYHIKLAIADVKDHSFDSAVFLAANSFNSGGNAVVEANIPKTISADKETVYEGCDSTAITFTRLDADDSQPVTIKFNVDNLASSAIEGTDYETLPKSITIPAGQMSAKLPVKVMNDNIIESDEKIVLKVETSCTCEETKVAIKIRDMPPFSLAVKDTAFCGTQSITLTSAVKGGIGKVNYSWSNGVTAPNITVQAGVSTKFILTVKDGCGIELSDEAQVTIAEPPVAALTATDFEVCRIGQNAKVPITLTGTPPFTLNYLLNGQTKNQTITQNQIFLNIDTVGFIQLKNVSTGSCKGFVSGGTLITLKPILLTGTPNDLNCYDAKNGAIELKPAGGGTAPFTYEWSNGDKTQNIKGLAAGKYSVTLTDPNLCKAVFETVVKEPTQLLTEVKKTTPSTCADLKGGSAQVSANGGTKPYSFTWATGVKDSKIDNLTEGTYIYTVTDANGCLTSHEAAIKSDTVKPKSLDYEAISPSCRTEYGSVFVKTAGGGIAPYTFALDSTFSNNKIYQKLLPNTYVLTVRGSNGCTNAWNIRIPTYEEPEVSLSPLDTLILPGDSVQLIATHNVPDKILKSITWDPDYGLSCKNCTDPLAKPKTPMVYTIKIKDKFDCEATASARIRFNRNIDVYIPNIINPLSVNQQNRVVGVYGNPRQLRKINVFKVFDRWGTEVYSSIDMLPNDQREGWDGTIKNSDVIPGAYIYFTEILLYNGEVMRKSGDITVVR